MEVFVLTTEWQNDYGEHEFNIKGVYSSYEAAKDEMMTCYEDDVSWLNDNNIEIETNDVCEFSTVISDSNWETYSINTIEKTELK